MTAEHVTPEPEQEREYPDEARAEALAIIRDIIGGDPDPEMLTLADQREEEFAARRAHAA
ncbi:hypothetical protein AB0L44_15055 [Nonomuraea wenchangensis]|uniref:hypothetical protein n=1 Tax=Nonomuraea wenchangensis TaxID=568860 RepID=UPI003420D13B